MWLLNVLVEKTMKDRPVLSVAVTSPEDSFNVLIAEARRKTGTRLVRLYGRLAR